MSLQIVGSCSRITRNIIVELAKQNQYNHIVVNDLLPAYDFHIRYYRLRRQLADAKADIKIALQKTIQPKQLYDNIQSADDVLFVTHDYYHNVSSKTKLMSLVAQYAKNKSHLFFATPVEYDHFGFATPEENYLRAQNEVRELNSNATIIRSDIQDQTELLSYYQSSKNILEDQLLKLTENKDFAPRVVSAQRYAQIVAENMRNRTQGKLLCVRGEKEVRAGEVANVNHDLDQVDWKHARENIRSIASKYTGAFGQESELLTA